MSDAPERISVHAKPARYGLTFHVSHQGGSRPFSSAYIREDESKAREAAAHNRGLEDAAKIADRMAQELLSIPKQVAEQIADLIHAKMQKKPDHHSPH